MSVTIALVAQETSIKPEERRQLGELDKLASTSLPQNSLVELHIDTIARKVKKWANEEYRPTGKEKDRVVSLIIQYSPTTRFRAVVEKRMSISEAAIKKAAAGLLSVPNLKTAKRRAPVEDPRAKFATDRLMAAYKTETGEEPVIKDRVTDDYIDWLRPYDAAFDGKSASDDGLPTPEFEEFVEQAVAGDGSSDNSGADD